MIILSITNCPPSLRGDLSRWLNEINTGVYIGKLSSRVCQEVWKRVCENIHDGQATMVYSSASTQGFEILVHNTTWKPVDYDGLTLMRRPLPTTASEGTGEELKEGFSKASKYERIRKRGRSSAYEGSFIIVDLETTGLNPDTDRIIEVGALRVRDFKISDKFQCLVSQATKLPENIVKLTNITDVMLVADGIPEEIAMERLKEFIGTDVVLGYNVKFDIAFLEKACQRNNIDLSIKRTKDILEMARRNIEDLPSYKMENIAKHFDIDITCRHRALPDCETALGIYIKLNKN